MKKSLKILTLVLSLALICGALVVAAFAGDTEVTGIETKLYWDFNNQAEGDINFTAVQYKFQSQPVQGSGYNFYDGSNRQGKVSIGSSKTGGGSDNLYLLWTSDHNCTGAACTICKSESYNAYLAAGLYPLNYNNYVVDPETKLFSGQNTQDGKYSECDFVCEADIWSPEGYTMGASGGATLKFHTYGVAYSKDASGNISLKANWVGDLIPNVLIKADEFGTYVALNHGSAKKVYIDRGSWVHVTLSVNAVINDGEIDIYATLWLNGEYVATEFIGTTSDGVKLGNKDEFMLVNGTDFIFGGDWRWQVTNSYAKENDAMAVDNMMVRQINREEYKASGGNLYDVIDGKKNLSAWESNLYDRANMPYGKTIVTNGDVEYDNLQYALDMASTGDELVLCGNVNADVTINKELTLVTAGYTTGQILAGDDLSIFNDGEGTYWTEVGGTVEVLWAACECGMDSCDEAHPGDITTLVGVGGNIFASYEAAGKSHTWTCTEGEDDDLVIYKLIGWEDVDGNAYTADDVITLEHAESGLLELYPIIVSSSPTYKYTTGGNVVYAFSDTTKFANALQAADANTTFYLLDNVLDLNSYYSSGIQPKDNVTFDLNGCTLWWVQDQGATKSPLFGVLANRTFTVTTSKPGAKILSGKMFADKTDASSTQGGPVFMAAGKNATINVVGTNGLTVMSAQLALFDGANYGTLNITGGAYVQPARSQDSWAVMQMCCFKELNLKDAEFIVFNSGRHIVGTMGNGAAPTEGSKVTIDGCNFVGGAFNRGDFPELEVTVTNSYIQGKIDLTERFTARGNGRATHGMEGGTWTFGEGCYFGTDISTSGVTLAEGYKLYEVIETVDYPYTTNTWTYGNVEESIKFTEGTVSATYNYKVIKDIAPITVNWNDSHGVLLGTTTAVPGMVAIAPSVPVEGTDGWVEAIYTTWKNHTGVAGEALVPEDAADGYTFQLVEGSEATYVAGKVPMYINYTIVLHFEVNIYFPANAPEGITDVTPNVNGSVPTRIGTGNIINGVNMNRYNSYPGAAYADRDFTAGVSFTYNGQTITYTTPGFNIGDYAQYIFNGEYDKEVNEAVLAMINFVDASSVAMKDAVSDELVAAQALAAEKGITVENVTVDTTKVGDYSALSEYVSGVQIAIGSQGGVQLQFIAKDPANAEGLMLNYIFESGETRVNQKWFNNGFWYCHNTFAYSFDDVITLQLTDGENILAECEYSVWDYAAAMWDELDDNQKNLIIATLTWAKYAEEIR